MARKRSGGRGGRSKAFRTPMFRVTCKGCGKVEKIPVRPLPDIDMYCMDCVALNEAKAREAAKETPKEATK